MEGDVQCVCASLFLCSFVFYLQRLEEPKGAQTSAAGHQAEGGVVEHLLVVISAK